MTLVIYLNFRQVPALESETLGALSESGGDETQRNRHQLAFHDSKLC